MERFKSKKMNVNLPKTCDGEYKQFENLIAKPVCVPRVANLIQCTKMLKMGTWEFCKMESIKSKKFCL